MDDAFAVGGLKAFGDLEPERPDLLDGQPAGFEAGLERVAFHQLHGNERAAVGLADVVDGRDVGVIERRRRAGFGNEALFCLRVVAEILWEEFQRDEAFEPRILCLVHDPHAALAQFREDAIVGNRCADHVVASPRGPNGGANIRPRA